MKKGTFHYADKIQYTFGAFNLRINYRLSAEILFTKRYKDSSSVIYYYSIFHEFKLQ